MSNPFSWLSVDIDPDVQCLLERMIRAGWTDRESIDSVGMPVRYFGDASVWMPLLSSLLTRSQKEAKTNPAASAETLRKWQNKLEEAMDRLQPPIWTQAERFYFEALVRTWNQMYGQDFENLGLVE